MADSEDGEEEPQAKECRKQENARGIKEKEVGEPYYLNDDAREMAQFMFENPEYKVLFDASRKISKEDIETVKNIMDKFRSPDAD